MDLVNIRLYNILLTKPFSLERLKNIFKKRRYEKHNFELVQQVYGGEKMKGVKKFCETCKNHEEEKDMIEQIEKDLWENVLKGGYDF